MNRLTDNDKNWGPFTLARWNKQFSACFSYGEDEDPEAQLLFVAFGWAFRVRLTKGGKEGVEKVYGISLSDMGNGYDFLQIKYGIQTWDGDNTKSWCKHFPWKQWDCVRHSIYSPDGTHFATEERRKWDEFYEAKQRCPASKFRFKDYDGEEITATCIIEEREWHRGEGWFKWLRHFYPARVRRTLNIEFSSEVGTEKGSWKGGTIGTGIKMLADETPEQAFRRYCEKDHERKGRTYRLTFLNAA